MDRKIRETEMDRWFHTASLDTLDKLGFLEEDNLVNTDKKLRNAYEKWNKLSKIQKQFYYANYRGIKC